MPEMLIQHIKNRLLYTNRLDYGYNHDVYLHHRSWRHRHVQMTKLATGYQRDGILQSSKSSVSTCTLFESHFNLYLLNTKYVSRTSTREPQSPESLFMGVACLLLICVLYTNQPFYLYQYTAITPRQFWKFYKE